MTSTKHEKRRPRKTENVGSSEKIATPGDLNASYVYVGRKPVMNYVVACLTYFNSGSKRLSVKARGRAIPKAVDTVEVLRRSLAKDLVLENITVCTEEVPREQGRKSNVSTIEIALSKP